MDEQEIKKIVSDVVRRLGGGAAPVKGSVDAQEKTENEKDTVRRVAVGADHGGYPAKEALIPFLKGLGYRVTDVGTHGTESVDYPDFAVPVARKVASGECDRGVMIDGAGIGSCMACNKIRGIRAALCYDTTTAVNSREHNNANVLTLGGTLHAPDVLCEIVRVWLETRFSGGRHWRRVNKIMALERE